MVSIAGPGDVRNGPLVLPRRQLCSLTAMYPRITNESPATAVLMDHMSDNDLSRNRKSHWLMFRSHWRGLIAGCLAMSIACLGMLVSIPAHAAVTGPGLYDNIRYGNGSWQGWDPPTQPPGQPPYGSVYNTYVGADVHVDVINSSGWWDNVRYSDGSWQGWAKPPQPPGTVYNFAETSDGYNAFFVADTGSNDLYIIERFGDGSWSNWASTPLPGNASVGDLSATVTFGTDEQLQIAVMLAGGSLWHNIYNVDYANWQGWAKPTQVPNGDFSIAVAGMNNGNAELMAVSGTGVLYFNIRDESGSWQGWQEPSQPPNLTTYLGTVSASVDGDGNGQFILTEKTDANNDQWVAYHDIRYTSGSWQGWNQVNTGCPWAAPVVAAQTWTTSTGVEDAHVDEMCGQA